MSTDRPGAATWAEGLLVASLVSSLGTTILSNSVVGRKTGPQRCLRGFSGGSVHKESACNARDHLQCRRPEFDPWVGKISLRRKWQLTPVFLPGASRGHRSSVGYSPWGRKSWTRLSD